MGVVHRKDGRRTSEKVAMQTAHPIVMTRDRAETGLIQGRANLERALEELTIASRILASISRQEPRASGVEEAVGRLEATLEALRSLD
jgi:hypothetical protein